MNRATRLFRIGSPSIKERNRRLTQALRYASIVDAALITVVKATGSSLKEGEYTLIIPDAKASAAREYERLNIADGENGSLVMTVTPDPDMLAQMKAFKKEMEEFNAPKVAEGNVNLVGEA